MFAGRRSKKSDKSRKQKGNMVILGCFAMTFSAFLLIIGYSYAGLVFVQNHLKNSAEEIALTGALKLNEMDNVGQMNNMLARNRQLVFAQQSNYDTAQASGSMEIQNLATEVLEESKQSAALLESERVKLKPLVENDADEAMSNKLEEISATYMVDLPWLKIGRPAATFKVGKIEGVQSSVAELPVQADLAASDRSQKLVQLNPKGLNLYLQGVDHKLPSPNQSLTYKLSSLPAPVNGQASPARVLPDQSLEYIQDGYFCSATQVLLSVRVQAGIGPSTSTVNLTSTGLAIAAGADSQL